MRKQQQTDRLEVETTPGRPFGELAAEADRRLFRALFSDHAVPYSFHSFNHSGDLYSTSSRHYYSEALPAQSRPKRKDLREM